MASNSAITLENLLLARERLAIAMAEAALNPMPDYDLDGQEFLWGDYMSELAKQLEATDDLIRRFGPIKIVWLGRKREDLAEV